MYATKQCLYCALLVCTLYGLPAMAAIVRSNESPSSNMDVQEPNLPIGSDNDVHSREKRQSNGTEEKFNMEDFVAVMKYDVVDVVIVLDRSWGMGKRDFYLQQKKLARSIINQYTTLHPQYTHLAVVTFALDVEVPIDYITPGRGTAITKTELFHSYDRPWEKVLYRLDPAISKGTYVHLALRKAREILQAGKTLGRGATPVVILMTDGDYQSEYDATTRDEATALHKMGAFVFTVGLGSWLSIANVRQVATLSSWYGGLDDWREGLALPGLMTTATADTEPIWTTFPEARDREFCLQECVDGQCDTDAITGITECRCSPGFYLLNRHCTECPSHTYKDTVGNEECKVCAHQLGYGTRNRGAKSITECECLNANCAGTTCQQYQCTEPHKLCSHVNGGEAQCVCDTGFVDNGNGTCINVNNCVNNRCMNGATCLDSVDTYICIANWGLEGRYSERIIDKCAPQLTSDPMCVNNGNCSYEQFRNDFECDCPAGFEGYYCQDTIKTTTMAPTPIPNPRPTNDGTNQDGTTQDPNISKTGGEEDDNLFLIIIIAACAGGFLLIVIIIISICCICRARRKKQREEEEKRKAELDAQLRQKGGRYTKKPRQLPKTISQKFSGFWKKKTVRGGMWADGDNMTEGAPSAPPKRRPDLLSTADNPEGNLHVVDEVVIGNTVIDDPGSMKGWKSYLNDLEQSGMIKSGIIANTEGGKAACTLEYVENNSENDRLTAILDNKDVNIPVHIQRWEFQVLENDGTYMQAASIGDLQETLNVVAARTRKYLIVLIATADIDMEKLKKETEYITDHISSEGY